MALDPSPEFLALEALLLSIVESFEQYKEHGVSYITFLYNCFESGLMKILCKEFYFRPGGLLNWLGNFVRGPYKKHLSEIILHLEVVQEMSFKDISYLELWGHLV